MCALTHTYNTEQVCSLTNIQQRKCVPHSLKTKISYLTLFVLGASTDQFSKDKYLLFNPFWHRCKHSAVQRGQLPEPGPEAG
jgi:hypothetical protein